jgi:hypothetical protein
MARLTKTYYPGITSVSLTVPHITEHGPASEANSCLATQGICLNCSAKFQQTFSEYIKVHKSVSPNIRLILRQP